MPFFRSSTATTPSRRARSTTTPVVSRSAPDEMRPDLDAVIAMRSTGWSLARLNAVDRNLLRLALYEMLCVDGLTSP